MPLDIVLLVLNQRFVSPMERQWALGPGLDLLRFGHGHGDPQYNGAAIVLFNDAASLEHTSLKTLC